MAAWPPDLIDSLRNQRGLTDIRSAGTPLTCAGSSHSHIPTLPKDALVSDEAEAREFVKHRVTEGSDYIKLVADVPGPSQEVLNAATAEARRHDRIIVAHAAAYEPVQMAIQAGVDVITHVPLDAAISEDDATTMKSKNRVSVPTLAMMVIY